MGGWFPVARVEVVQAAPAIWPLQGAPGRFYSWPSL